MSPFNCQVYFINKVVSMDVLWGTSSQIPIQDAVYKIILPIRANGQFAIQVENAEKMLVKLVGSMDDFNQNTVKRYFKGILMTNIKEYISSEFVKKQVSFLEVQTRLKEISEGIKVRVQSEFEEYGIKLVNFTINEIAPPDNDPSYVKLKKALAKKAEMQVMGYDYQQERVFDVLDKAASNLGMSSDIMGAGMGIGMGINMGAFVGGTMNGAMSNIQTQNENEQEQKLCKSCGAKILENAKFCLECGTKVEKKLELGMCICPQCREKVPEGKFCLKCGAKLRDVCKKCGAELVQGAKFCLECGEKIE